MEIQPSEKSELRLTSSATEALIEKEADDQAAIDEVLGPFEDEADRLRTTALESHLQPESSGVNSSRQRIAHTLFVERNQPIINERERHEGERLRRLITEKGVKPSSQTIPKGNMSK